MYDFVIIGSGFGGAVSALRLSEKGYKVLVIEKGKWYKAEDYPNTNWNLRKWLWMPKLKCFGIQKLTFLRHITVLSGTGVGGGSLVYANTLPKPKKAYYHNGSWVGLADWEIELEPFYDLAWKMLGATKNPTLGQSDRDFMQLAQSLGIEDKFNPTKVAVYFGDEGEEVTDPYFSGKGPTRTGCIKCGACMTGCKHNAKNTLDNNYLHLAQQEGAQIMAESEVFDVIPMDELGDTGYDVVFRKSTRYFGKRKHVRTKGIVFSGGVLGTVPLLLKLKKRSLPLLSNRVGDLVRTNNEALIGNVSFDKERDMTEGVAIGSIIDLDENTHIEPVRYGNKSGFWRLLLMPMVTETNFFIRFLKLLASPIREFRSLVKSMGIRDFAKQTSIILFMQHLDSTLKLKLGWFGLKSTAGEGQTPTAFIPEAHRVARMYAKQIKGVNRVLGTETLTGIPTTAHILGGAVIGEDKETGVIDKNNKVFDYHNMYVCDGSMISANPGVNPSLGITALAERAMSKIPDKNKT